MGVLRLSALLPALTRIAGLLLSSDGQVVFPPEISTKLIPGVDIDPVVAVNFLIGGGIKTIVCIYAAAMGITQLFGLEDYKILVLPLTAITIALSMWLYESLFEMLDWASNIWPYYSIPFQIIIPLTLLLISWFKRRKDEKTAAK